MKVALMSVSVKNLRNLKATVFAFAILAVAFASLNSLHAGILTVINPSFESQSLAGPGGAGNFISGTLTGWSLTGTGPQGVFKPGTAQYPFGIPDGVNVAFSNGGTISQVLMDVLAPTTSYTLSVDVGDRLDLSFPAYRIDRRRLAPGSDSGFGIA